MFLFIHTSRDTSSFNLNFGETAPLIRSNRFFAAARGYDNYYRRNYNHNCFIGGFIIIVYCSHKYYNVDIGHKSSNVDIFNHLNLYSLSEKNTCQHFRQKMLTFLKTKAANIYEQFNC